MSLILVLGHGRFSSGIQCALEQIIGIQENIKFIDFPESKNVAQLEEEIKIAIQSTNHENGILFCCDILGGTPFRVASSTAFHYSQAEVISGTNLQMLIECAMEKDDLNFDQLVKMAIEAGKRGVVKLSDQLKQDKRIVDLDKTDGI